MKAARHDLDELIDGVWRQCLADRGFARKQRLFVRSDALLRSVRFDVSKWAERNHTPFSVICNLGLPTLSAISATTWSWMVSIELNGLQPRRERIDFAVGDNIELDRVAAAVRGALGRAFDDFLFAVREPVELYRLVLDGWDRLDSWNAQPFNPVPRLELGAAYARFLGMRDEESGLRARIADTARETGLDELVPEINARLDAVVRA